MYEVEHELSQPALVAQHEDGNRRLHPDLNASGRRCGSEGFRDVVGQDIEPNRRSLNRDPAGIRPRQHQKVGGDRAQSVDIVTHGEKCLAILSGFTRLGQGHIDGAPHGGERPTQLMRRIGSEPSHRLEGGLETADHLIEGCNQAANLILRMRKR